MVPFAAAAGAPAAYFARSTAQTTAERYLDISVRIQDDMSDGVNGVDE